MSGTSKRYSSTTSTPIAIGPIIIILKELMETITSVILSFQEAVVDEIMPFLFHMLSHNTASSIPCPKDGPKNLQTNIDDPMAIIVLVIKVTDVILRHILHILTLVSVFTEKI